jgi:fructoselysine 6-kinase
MTRLDFAAVGDNCIDRFSAPLGLSLIGGNAINVAVQLARLGLATGYFGAIGPDEAGRATVAALAQNAVDTASVEIRDGVTAYTDIDVAADGERTLAFEDFGVCRGYTPSEANVTRLLAARHVHIGWFDDGGALKRRLHAAGVSVSQDVSVNADPANVTPDDLAIAFASAGASRDKGETLLRALLAAGVRCAVVTLGSLGSIAAEGDARAETGIRAVDVLDTTGAGDSFIAGFLGARLSGESLQASLEAGRDLAAVTCTHLGGFPQEPLRPPG